MHQINHAHTPPTQHEPRHRVLLFLKQYAQLIFLSVLLSCAAAILAKKNATQTIDWLIYDYAQHLAVLPSPDDVVIIDIDDKSIAALGRWPWPRSVHAQLLNTLLFVESGPVAFDILFSDLDSSAPESDKAFREALIHHGHVVLPLHIEKLGLQGQVIEMPPAKPFYQSAEGIGHVHISQDKDGVARSVFLKEGVGEAYWSHFSLALFSATQHTNSVLNDAVLSGEKNKQPTSERNMHEIVRDYLNYIPLSGRGDQPVHFSYVDVLNGVVTQESLQGKTVFVGATATGLGDVLTTSLGAMFGVELNVWIYQALKNKSFIRKVSPNYTAAINGFCVLCLLFFLGKLNPRTFLYLSVFASIFLISVSIVMHAFFGIWLSLVSSTLAVIVFYPFWNWLRLEAALRYLRSELYVLTHDKQNSIGEAEAYLSNCMAYLQDIGVIDKWDMFEREHDQNNKKNVDVTIDHANVTLSLDRYTVKSIVSKPFQTLFLTSSNTQPLSQLLYQTLNSKSVVAFNSNGDGVELISQTIAHINSVKKRAHADQKLVKQSLAKLQDAVVIADIFGQIIFTNNAFSRLVGADDDTFLLDCLSVVTLDDNRPWQEIIGSLYLDGTSVSGQARHEASDIDIFFQARLARVYSDVSDTVIITLTDITALRSAEKARMDALNFLSHDLRSPMVSVLAIIDRHRDDNALQATLSPIEQLVRKNLQYAESFLQLSRANALQESQLYLVDLHSVFDSAHVHALALANSKHIDIVTSRFDGDAWVLGDNDLLERALINLISNAVKFSQPGCQITMSLASDGDYLDVSVSDSGCGIAEEDTPHIFERFARSSRAKDEYGAGLGLHFVATTIKRHGGNVSVESAINKGSTFTIRLPCTDFS